MWVELDLDLQQLDHLLWGHLGELDVAPSDVFRIACHVPLVVRVWVHCTCDTDRGVMQGGGALGISHIP